MTSSDPRSMPTILERPRNLPSDIIHAREVQWLGELQSRLAAVQAWRGFNAHHASRPVDHAGIHNQKS